MLTFSRQVKKCAQEAEEQPEGRGKSSIRDTMGGFYGRGSGVKRHTGNVGNGIKEAWMHVRGVGGSS